MAQTEQIHKKQEFYDNIENSEPTQAVENNEILLKNAYTTLIGLVNQIENQLGKIPVNNGSNNVSKTLEQQRKMFDSEEIDNENEGITCVERGVCDTFGMRIEISNELLKNYYDAGKFRAKIVEKPLNQRQLVILDFTELTKLSSLEIGHLVSINEILKGEGTFAIAMHMNEQVEILVHMMGAESMFVIFRDFDALIKRLVGSDKYLHFAEEQPEQIQTHKKDEEEEDTTKLIYEIKEKLDKVRGFEKPAPQHIPKPTLNKKSILSMSVLIILIIAMGVVWVNFFSAISKSEMPTEEEINAHFNEFKLESHKME
ncbi:MAG: hypothetical protein K8S87_00405 [Planctomycetes bacterium]|nr:hypothetical protein [Planctomycetota bacterium]